MSTIKIEEEYSYCEDLDYPFVLDITVYIPSDIIDDDILIVDDLVFSNKKLLLSWGDTGKRYNYASTRVTSNIGWLELKSKRSEKISNIIKDLNLIYSDECRYISLVPDNKESYYVLVK